MLFLHYTCKKNPVVILPNQIDPNSWNTDEALTENQARKLVLSYKDFSFFFFFFKKL